MQTRRCERETEAAAERGWAPVVCARGREAHRVDAGCFLHSVHLILLLCHLPVRGEEGRRPKLQEVFERDVGATLFPTPSASRGKLLSRQRGGGIRCCCCVGADDHESAVRSDTQPVDGIASCHRAANCAESDRADRSAVPAAAARADCTTARVRLRPRRLVLASTASEAFAGAERDPDRGEGLL